MRKYQQYRDDARSSTLDLCIILSIAVVGTIAVSTIALAGIATGATYSYLTLTTNIEMPPEHWRDMFLSRLCEAGILTTLAVVGTACYRAWQLAEGGGSWVARSMGGTKVIVSSPDPNHVKVRNVVEELAIATGLKTPAIYVLENEPGINAFAAGSGPKDAVIGVTRGAIDRLKRHQLQGIIAHEFSHIANGDMLLNVRLLAVMSGVEVVSFAARSLLRMGMPGSLTKGGLLSGKHPLGMVLALAFGAAIWPVGQVGSLFACLIRLATNRQREFLADASAVQYTRDPHGLCEALRILLEDEIGGRMQEPAARLASHMCFAPGGVNWNRLLATHPPLEERIQRLDPNQPQALLSKRTADVDLDAERASHACLH